MFAVAGTTPYNIVLVLHILFALAAFAPAFVHPFLATQTKALDDGTRRQVLAMMAGNGRRVYAPALIIMGLLGFALSGMSDGLYAMSQGWLIASTLIWVAINGSLHAVLLPAERAVVDGDSAAERKVEIGGAVLTVLLLVVLYLMVFKPGL